MPGQGYGCVLTTLPTELSVSEDGKGNTTLTEVSNSLTYGGGKPGQGYGCVLTAYGFKPRQSAKARSVGFEQDVFPTLEISQNSAVIYENNNDRHSED